MVFVIYVAPNYTENAVRFIEKLAIQDDVLLGIISQEPIEWLPKHIQHKIKAYHFVQDVFNAHQLLVAAKNLSQKNGNIHRIIGAVEQAQVPLAIVREEMGIPGMGVETMKNFRDKSRMKNILASAGLPCAKHALAKNKQELIELSHNIGLPVVVKPPDGAASQNTFKINTIHELESAAEKLHPSEEHPILIEEMVVGTEHSFDTYSLNGQHVFHSLTNYHPTPLQVLQDPWIQWQVILPREVDDVVYDDIRSAAFRTLNALGMETAMSHLEWFRRNDGSLAISEVAARPPGAQFTTLISRAHDFDSISAWVRMMIFGEFTSPQRKYAVGAAYLRGMGEGKVSAVTGLEEMNQMYGHLFTDVKIPKIGQDKGATYEGEGFIILRHPETQIVQDAVNNIVSNVRVHLGR